jgi:hypothetical protein
VRADLLALTPDAVAALANAGLVKRALKELEAGAGPSLAEALDGAVIGTFADGVQATLPAGVTLKHSACSCGAKGICRHRVAVALGYRGWHEQQSSSPAGPAAQLPWWPGELTDERLELALGAQRLARAREVAASGVLVTLEPGVTPVARLPTCSVRFLVPHDLSYARCDCSEQAGCEHVALAVWAFRLGTGAGTVELGVAGSAGLELEIFGAIGDAVLELGVARVPSLAARFATLRRQALDGGLVWLDTLLVDLEQCLDGWRARSALYTAEDVRGLLVELEARLRAAKQGGELPVRYVLGSDEAAQTLLDHVRLISLGARLRADGSTRFADVFLFDPDSITTLVLRKRWADATEVGAELGRRAIAPKVALSLLAHGQVVSKAVLRNANRTAELGSSRANQTSVTPQSGDWSMVRAPVRVDDVSRWQQSQRGLPPKLLRPRVLAEHLHVVDVARVVDVVSVPADQAVVAVLEDQAGNQLEAVVRHRAVAPNALGAAAAAFEQPVRFVSGELASSARGVRLEVLAISSGARVVVPDLSAPVASHPLATAQGRSPSSALGEVLNSAQGLLDELLLSGLSSPDPSARRRLPALAATLTEHGLTSLGQRIEGLRLALEAGRTAAACEAWRAAGVRLELLRDCLER